MKIYLDDERTAPNGWKLIKTPKEVIKLLKTGKVTELSLDHDLGDDKKIGTGYDVLLWLEKEVYINNFKPPKIIKVHSANISARTKMEQAIQSIKKKTENKLSLKKIYTEVAAKYISELKYLHRWMDVNELLKLLKSKSITSTKPFVSFTLDPMRIKSAGFSGCAVTFDRRKFESLNKSIEIYYEPDFMRLHPDICLYVTGYKGESDWDNMGFIDWSTYILDYEDEQEVVVKKSYKIDKNTIIHIEIPKKYKKQFQQFESEFNIEYD